MRSSGLSCRSSLLTPFGDFGAAKDAECRLYFDTPRGFEFKELRFEELSFDLTPLAKSKQPKD